MSEISECAIHPTEDDGFRRSVLRMLLGRQAFAEHARSLGHNESVILSSQIITAEGVDEAYSAIVNDCADRIALGLCERFTMTADGFDVTVVKREG